MQKQNSGLEIVRISNARFEQGQGVVQIDSNWPSKFIDKVMQHFNERSKGATFEVMPFPVMSSREQSPWELGFVAYYAGHEQSDNPYMCPSENCYWWNQGYECAELDSQQP